MVDQFVVFLGAQWIEHIKLFIVVFCHRGMLEKLEYCVRYIVPSYPHDSLNDENRKFRNFSFSIAINGVRTK